MRERLTRGGLRGRLLVAFVVTSMLTLAVVGAIVLGPLQNQLREQSVETLNDALVASSGQFSAALRADPAERLTLISNASFDLRERVDTRVLVDADDDETALPEFTYDSDFTPSTTRDATVAALTAIREDRTVTNFDGDQVTIALRLRNPAPGSDGVLVAERRLTEVAAAADQVRNALLAGAGVGLLVAIALAITLSGTLLRRLARLRAAALRITKEGPDAPAPRDKGRDEVGDLALALARMQEELRRQEAARRSFVSTASHELRTPLTMLQGTMELLEEDLRDGAVDIEDAQLQVTNASRPWPASCSTSAGSTPPCSCAPSRWSSGSWPARWPPSSSCAPGSATSPSRSARRPRAAGVAATRTRWREWCGSCSTTRSATARPARRSCSTPRSATAGPGSG